MVSSVTELASRYLYRHVTRERAVTRGRVANRPRRVASRARDAILIGAICIVAFSTRCDAYA